MAEALEADVPVLRELGTTWAGWLAHTAGTRAAADRAHAALANRHALDIPDDQRVTTAGWAAAHDDADQREDPHREITEHDLADDAHAEIALAKEHVQPADTIDLRELVADEDHGADEDIVRVPTAAETSDSVRRAERALAEIRSRTMADAAREAEEAERSTRVEYWRSDYASDQAERVDEQVPTMERTYER